MSLQRTELSRRNFLKLLAAVGTSTALGLDLSLSQAQSMPSQAREMWDGALIRNGFYTGAGYVTAPFWTPGMVPSHAALDAVWRGHVPAKFGFWVDRMDQDGEVVTPVLPISQGEFWREYRQHGVSRFGTFPVDQKAQYWLGVAFLSELMEIQHILEMRVIPLWEDE